MAGTSPSLVTAKKLESNLQTENQELFAQKIESSKYIHTYTNVVIRYKQYIKHIYIQPSMNIHMQHINQLTINTTTLDYIRMTN